MLKSSLVQDGMKILIILKKKKLFFYSNYILSFINFYVSRKMKTQVNRAPNRRRKWNRWIAPIWIWIPREKGKLLFIWRELELWKKKDGQLKRQAFTPRKKPRLLTRLQAYYPTFYNINAPLSLTICLSAEDCYRSSSKRKNRKASHKTQLCLACACWISCFCMYKNNQWPPPTSASAVKNPKP